MRFNFTILDNFIAMPIFSHFINFFLQIYSFIVIKENKTERKKHCKPIKLAQGAHFVKSGHIKHDKLNLSPFDQPIQDFSFVPAKGNILPIEVSVSSFYFS